jgi:hypothetical protein
MLAWVGVFCLALAAAGQHAHAADVVTLRGGKTVLGQLVEPSPRGTLTLLVRRAWLEAQQPELAKRWEAEEKSALRRAQAQRRSRLEAWKRERAAGPEPNDRIGPWIDQALEQLQGDGPGKGSRLMVVTLTRGQVQSVQQQPKSSARLLRLGWRAGFPNVEIMDLGALEDALESRGFDLKSHAPVALDSLLPLPVETEAQWLARRAATEVTFDSGLRFLRLQQLLVPEPAPGQALDARAALSVLPDLSKLLSGEATDPLPPRLRAVAAHGRAGAVVTRQEMSPELESVTVEITLWVRGAGDRWAPFGSRTAVVRSADVKDDEGKELADDPQIDAIFRVIGALGLGDVPADVKQKSLNIGAATRKALSQARGAVQDDLAGLALPVGEKGQP